MRGEGRTFAGIHVCGWLKYDRPVVILISYLWLRRIDHAILPSSPVLLAFEDQRIFGFSTPAARRPPGFFLLILSRFPRQRRYHALITPAGISLATPTLCTYVDAWKRRYGRWRAQIMAKTAGAGCDMSCCSQSSLPLTHSARTKIEGRGA